MLEQIVPQVKQKVKCTSKYCGEVVFRNGLCFDHFIEVETQTWDDEDVEQQMVLGTIGHVIFFGDTVEVPA